MISSAQAAMIELSVVADLSDIEIGPSGQLELSTSIDPFSAETSDVINITYTFLGGESLRLSDIGSAIEAIGLILSGPSLPLGEDAFSSTVTFLAPVSGDILTTAGQTSTSHANGTVIGGSFIGGLTNSTFDLGGIVSNATLTSIPAWQLDTVGLFISGLAIVPEPSTLTLFWIGLGGLSFRGRRRTMT